MSGSYKHWRGIWQGFWSRFSGGPHKTRSRCEKYCGGDMLVPVLMIGVSVTIGYRLSVLTVLSL